MKNDVTIEIAPGEDGVLHLQGLLGVEGATSLRTKMREVSLRGEVKLRYHGLGVFDGCKGLKRVEWEKLFSPTFAWDGQEVLSTFLRLRFEGVEEVDLSAWFSGEGEEFKGKVRWEEIEGEPVVFAPGEEVKHTYGDAGVHWIEISPDETQGYLRMEGLTENKNVASVASIRAGLTEVDARGEVKVKYMHRGIFDGCDRLEKVAWDKLFLRDFAWENEEEQFEQALLLSIVPTEGWIDLSPWFFGTGYGRVKWGDHGEIWEFTPETPKENFRHSYGVTTSEKKVEIIFPPEQDRLIVSGLCGQEGAEGLRMGLREVDMRGEVPIEFKGDGVFDGCTGLRFVAWEKLFSTTFAWEEEKRVLRNLRFTFSIDAPGQILDLSAWFADGSTGIILWDDGGMYSHFSPEADGEVFRHTYASPGEYSVWIELDGEEEELILHGLGTSLHRESVASIREALIGVDMKGDMRMKYIGNGAFQGCKRLTYIAWGKLFSDSVVYPVEPVAENAVRFRLSVSDAESPADLSAWLQGGEGKVHWGDRSGVLEYRNNTPASDLRHFYSSPGVYWVEVEPNEGAGLTFRGLLTAGAGEESTTFLRSALIEVDKVGIVDVEWGSEGAFDSCERLEKVAWEKIFRENET